MAATTASPNNKSVAFKGKPAKEAKSDERDWEAESALRTMQEAEQHQQNPDMMKRVAAHAGKQRDGLDAVMAKMQKAGTVSDKQAAKFANRRKAARK